MHTARLRNTKEEFRVGKIICVGRNYAEHAKEMKADLPESPVLFLKPSTALVDDGGTIIIPPIKSELHHEVELTVLIETGGKNITEKSALSHIAGYGIGLDMTLRDVQAEAKKKGLPWTLAKGFDTSAPISEFIPASKVNNPHALDLKLRLNGVVKQNSNTRHFIFRIEQLISYISQFFTLEPGDIIFTGTPEGVGPVRPGDHLEAELSEPDGELLVSLKVAVR